MILAGCSSPKPAPQNLGVFLFKIELVGVSRHRFLLENRLYTPHNTWKKLIYQDTSTALSDTWRDSIREEAQKYDHSDYPEYERPDKQQFLDSYYRSEGIYNTNALVVRFKNGFDPEAVTRDLVYQENPDNLDKRTSELSNFKGILAEYAVVSFIEPISSVPSEILEKDRLEAEFFTNRQFPDLRLYYRIIFEDN